MMPKENIPIITLTHCHKPLTGYYQSMIVCTGGTTVSINYLKKWGYIKPIPPPEKLKEMYHEKKATLIRETTEELKLQQEKLKKTRENVIRGYRERAGKPEKLESKCKAKKQE
jgi:hypothetical protein